MNPATKEVLVTCTDHSHRRPRELAYRVNDGLEVRLLWTELDNRVFVHVHDKGQETGFEFDVDPKRALDAFEHPLAYAALPGIAPAVAARRGDTLMQGV